MDGLLLSKLMELVVLNVEITKKEEQNSVMTEIQLTMMGVHQLVLFKLVTKIVHVMVGNLLFIMVCAAVYVEINSFAEHKNAMMGINLISTNVTQNVLLPIKLVDKMPNR